MPDYQNSKIYRLWSVDTDKIYIGSTTQKLCNRLAKHKSSHNSCCSKTLFEISDNVKIELIELYPCNSREELNKREGELIRSMECVNRCIAGRTKKEYNKEYSDEHKEQMKEYREANKEKIAKLKKEYYVENIEKIKEYNEANKDKKKEYNNEYYQKNKAKIKS